MQCGGQSMLGKRKERTVHYQTMSNRDRDLFRAAVHLLRSAFSDSQRSNHLMQQIKCIHEDVAQEVELSTTQGLAALEQSCKKAGMPLDKDSSDVGKRVFVAWVGPFATCIPDNELTNADMAWYRGIVLEHNKHKKNSHKIGYEDGQIRWHNADDMIRRDQWSWIHVA